jgi:hypothetical protein
VTDSGLFVLPRVEMVPRLTSAFAYMEQVERLVTRFALAQLLGVSRYHSLITKRQPDFELFLGNAVVPVFRVPTSTQTEQTEEKH